MALRQAGVPRTDSVGFKVANEADLDTFAQWIEAFGTKVEEVPAEVQPGADRYRPDTARRHARPDDLFLRSLRVWSIDKISATVSYYQRELNERFMSVVTRP